MAVYAVFTETVGFTAGLATSGTKRESGSSAWSRLNPIEIFIKIIKCYNTRHVINH